MSIGTLLAAPSPGEGTPSASNLQSGASHNTVRAEKAFATGYAYIVGCGLDTRATDPLTKVPLKQLLAAQSISTSCGGLAFMPVVDGSHRLPQRPITIAQGGRRWGIPLVGTNRDEM